MSLAIQNRSSSQIHSGKHLLVPSIFTMYQDVFKAKLHYCSVTSTYITSYPFILPARLSSIFKSTLLIAVLLSFPQHRYEPMERSERDKVMKKWCSLIDKMYNTENLREAYKRVRANKEAPGLDGETAKEYGENLKQNLTQTQSWHG
jgi:hypothetical protein